MDPTPRSLALTIPLEEIDWVPDFLGQTKSQLESYLFSSSGTRISPTPGEHIISRNDIIDVISKILEYCRSHIGSLWRNTIGGNNTSFINYLNNLGTDTIYDMLFENEDSQDSDDSQDSQDSQDSDDSYDSYKGDNLFELNKTYKTLENMTTAINSGRDVNIVLGNRTTPLIKSIEMDSNIEIIKALIDAGADVNAQYTNGSTVLMFAISDCSDLELCIERMDLLLKAGAKVDEKDKNGMTSLLIAISNMIEEPRYENTVIIEKLLKAGADVNAKDQNGTTPLMYAVSGTLKEIVELLLKAGADVNAKDQNGTTPLMYAVSGTLKEIVELLLKAGADVNAKANDGETVLMHIKSIEILDMILKKGANVNEHDISGSTALINIVRDDDDDRLERVSLLLEYGAIIDKQDNYGYTALMYSTFHDDNDDVIEFLIQKGASLTIKNNTGMNVFSHAVKYKNTKYVKLLLDLNKFDLNDASLSQLKELEKMLKGTKYYTTIQEMIKGYYKGLLKRGIKNSFNKFWKWEEWCSKLGQENYDNLVEFAKELSLDYTGTKRELCVRISREFYDIVDGCKDYNLSGDALDELPRWRIYKIKGVCFDILDLDGIIKTGETRNPYTREPLPIDMIKERIDRLKRSSKSGELETDNILKRVREMPIFSIETELRNKVGKLFESFPYSLDMSLVTDISYEEYRDLYKLFYNIRYLLGIQLKTDYNKEKLIVLKMRLVDTLSSIIESEEKALIIYQTFVHFSKIIKGESTEDSMYTTIRGM
jgi:ankyrin repeat protein